MQFRIKYLDSPEDMSSGRSDVTAHKNHHNHSKQISNSNKENMMSDLFNTKQEAENAASKYGCIGAHKMGNKWMPCKMH